MVSLFASSSCFCCSLSTGLNSFLSLAVVLRLAGAACGCFYGPYLYLVLPLGGLYLAADALLLYAIWKALAAVRPVRIIIKNWQPVLGGRYLRRIYYDHF